MRDVREWLDAEVARAVDAAFVVMSCAPCYLYYSSGRLEVAPEAPAEMMLATAERVPSGRDRAGIRAWVRSRASGLPCLPAHLPPGQGRARGSR